MEDRRWRAADVSPGVRWWFSPRVGVLLGTEGLKIEKW